jgi:hypothetical protein
MPLFTAITHVSGSFHLSQHSATTPAAAVREHVGQLPYSEGAVDEAELDWLQGVAGGTEPVTVLEVTSCKGTWLWGEGARYPHQYLTYVVNTAREPAAAS